MPVSWSKSPNVKLGSTMGGATRGATVVGAVVVVGAAVVVVVVVVGAVVVVVVVAGVVVCSGGAGVVGGCVLVDSAGADVSGVANPPDESPLHALAIKDTHRNNANCAKKLRSARMEIESTPTKRTPQ